jgi:hypothetical protein
MRIDSHGALALLIAILMVGAVDVPSVATVPDAVDGETRHVVPFADGSLWTDPLDDLSHVYVNSSMPVGIEVSGGDAHLKAGESEGWIASEVIACPPGHRYDLVLLEVDMPGASYVNVSVLNASAVPTSGDFANGTIAGFELVDATDVSLNHIDAATYPRIRIQVDLHADGTDRPRLLAWTVYFIDEGEWRDDFLGKGKMGEHRNVNLTEGGLEITLDPSMSGGGSYRPYPTMAWGTSLGDIKVLYPLENRTGYQDMVEIDTGIDIPYCAGFGDFDQDGWMDMVAGGYNSDSEILWGDDTGTYSMTRSTDLPVDTVDQVVPGDFNGDGWTDILAVRYGVAQYSTCIFLNDGNGTFNSTPEVVFLDRFAVYGRTGNLNGDKYDDFILSSGGGVWGYHGGPSGPDTTPVFTIIPNQGVGSEMADLDQDGYPDVIIFGVYGFTTKIYMGGPFGVDSDPDYWISEPAGTQFSWKGACGDLNADGYLEIVIGYDMAGPGNDKMYIYPGSEDGWNTSDYHEINVAQGPYPTIADIDKDGYDDIIVYQWAPNNHVVDIFKGGPSLPKNYDMRKTALGSIYSPISIAIPGGSDIGSSYWAAFTTEDINLPEGMRWDIIDILATVPKNTMLRYEVLNETGSPLTGLLTDTNLDLASILPINQRTIRIRVRLTSELNDTTPTLERLLVNWIDEMAWRDEFYGPAKVDRSFDLDVAGGRLQGGNLGPTGPQLIIPSFRNDIAYTSMSYAHFDDGGPDYGTRSPLSFQTTGASAASVADVNGDGHLDVAFASYAASGYEYASTSPVFLSSPVGWKDLPYRVFNTTGARDVLLKDIDGDGHVDIVLAQERDDVTYDVDSLLYWGSPDGWAEKPDVSFGTKGATGVIAEDMDGDDLLDLVFACYGEPLGITDSMVFLQDEDGFDGAVADHLLATQGARAVAAGDLNGDDRPDLVFANSQSGTRWEIDSHVYLAKAGGGFEATPLGLPTKGAQDVKVADLDNDGHLDIVFADLRDDGGDHSIGSPVYLNDGSGGFPASPSHTLTTIGAVAVEVADLDGTGWKDLVFACHSNGTSYSQTSVGYLGGDTGWPSAPDIGIPTMGASDVVAAYLFEPGDCAYMSQSITPRDLDGTGGFHTLSYNATLGGGATGAIHVFDAITWEELASTTIAAGTHAWDLRGQVYFKAHNSIRVVVSVEGLDGPGTFGLDDLYVNWTERVRAPPEVVDIGLSSSSVLRTGKVTMWVNVTDEYDPPEELTLKVEHRLEGDPYWSHEMVGALVCTGGVWAVELTVGPTIPIGNYSFRVMTYDKDDMESDVIEALVTLEVVNNIPTAPEIALGPEPALTTSKLSVTITRSARDVEGSGLMYHFKWFRNGNPVPGLASDNVPPEHTSKGQNWSVEVRAFDGDDEGQPATAWVHIGNSPPVAKGPVEDIVIPEDGSDDSLLLAQVFQDPDGGSLDYGIDAMPEHIDVVIEEVTGRVTLTPEADWAGLETVTFWVSDGEFAANQTVLVQVTPVNDAPFFVDDQGVPVTPDMVVVTVDEGQELVLTFFVFDKEGDEVRTKVDSDLVELDKEGLRIILSSEDAVVGTIIFSLTIWDTASPGVTISREYTIQVQNVNDPMEVPRITEPSRGSSFDVNETFTLAGECDDPDVQYGQELEFSWSSNILGDLGTGSSLTLSLAKPGEHLITLTVSDGEFQESRTILVHIEPLEVEPPPTSPPPSNGGDDGDDEGAIPVGVWLIAGLVAVVLVIVAVLLVVQKRQGMEQPGEAEEQASDNDGEEQ